MRNLVLFAIFAILATYVYFSEEKTAVESYEQQVKDENLFDASTLGDLVSIKGSKFNLSKKGDDYFVNDKFPIDQNKLNTFFDQLLSIKIIRVIKPEELKELNLKYIKKKDAQKMIIDFEHNTLEFEVGMKLDINKSFYIFVNNKKKKMGSWAIAKFENNYTSRLNNKNEYRSSAPYKQVLAIFELGSEFFKNKNPFYKISTISKVKVQSFRNREYTIDFKLKNTLPMAPKRVKYNLEKLNTYLDLLKNHEFKKVSSKGSLKELIGYLFINEQFKFPVYRQHNEVNSYYILYKSLVYEFRAETFRNLFQPHQYFWDKKISTNFKEFTVFKANGEKLIVSKMTDINVWSKIFKSEANSVRAHTSSNFVHQYKIVANKRTFLLNQDFTGVTILDKESNLIFHFLDKIQ